MWKDTTFVMFLTTLATFWNPLRGAERAASCQLHSSCVLPCPFDPGPDEVIHWLKLPETASSVHSFYHGRDQLGLQQPRYKHRTALFNDQISRGNASLRITGIELADEGRYKCYTSTTKGNSEDFISVKVQAPVRDVLLEEDGERLKCESKNIIPKPSVSWSPPADPSTSVTKSETGLFSVISSVPLTRSSSLEYTCNISTEHSRKSATYRRTDGVFLSRSKMLLRCVETESSIKTLVWTFNRTQIILERNGSNTTTNPDWTSRLDPVPGSELVLKSLSSDHQGLYTCSLTTDLSTYLTVTEVTVTEESTSGSSTEIILGVTLSVLFVGLLALALWWCFRSKKPKPKNTKRNRDDHKMNVI